MSSWFSWFALTLVFEIPVVALVARRYRWPVARLCALALVANVLTHPLAFWALASARSFVGKTLVLTTSELLLIPIVEGLVYAFGARIDARRAIGLAYVANAASLVASLVASLAG